MTSQNTMKTTAIRPDATLLIQQDCGACHGTGEASDGAICVTCWGTRRVTCSITLADLAQAIICTLPEITRVFTGVRSI